jgi:hypothetical protein
MKWITNLLKRKDTETIHEDTVTVYDPKTKSVTAMPGALLTPSMVQVRVEGLDGVYWIDAGELTMGERRHESFPEEVIDHLREIKSKLDEVYPMSLEDWKGGFLRDVHPENEIASWLRVAHLYSRFTSKRNLSLEEKEEYFRILGTCMNSPKERVLQLHRPQLISKEEAEKVIGAFFADGFTISNQ